MDEIALPRPGDDGASKLITRVGFGCGRLVGGVSFRESAALIEAARRAGIKHFDTAPSYGLGLAEDVLGKVLAGDWPNLSVTTKIGIGRPLSPSSMAHAKRFLKPIASRFPFLMRAMTGAVSATSGKDLFSPREIADSFERSLAFLKTDRVDMLLLHEPKADTVTPDLENAMMSLVQSRVIGAYGASTDGASDSIPVFGSVRQSCWDPAEKMPAGSLQIRHGVLRHYLPRLSRAMKADPARTESLSRETGMPLSDDTMHPSVLLSLALGAAPGTIVLVSSKNPEKLAACVAGIDWTVARGERAAHVSLLRRFIEGDGAEIEAG